MINKPELISSIAEKTGASKAETERFLAAFQSVVIEKVAAGDEVRLSGFMTLAPSVRAARQMKNPRTGEPISVPETTVPKIRALKTFRDAVAGDKA